ncbi:hypothetical protein VTK26DRAFT_1817 [Humicola hyalothermophila]
MAQKRPRPDEEHSGRSFHENAARKRMRTNTGPKRAPQSAGDGLSAIKKRARAIERLLGRDNLKIPADKQKELERELAAHKQRIEDAKAKKERSKMIKKYHMVRFFERKKAMRLAKQLEKKLAAATDPEEVSRIKAELHIAQVDIDYAIYFPFMEPYVSLYAGSSVKEKGGKDEKDEKDDKSTAAQYLHAPRPPMWTVIEKTREEGKSALEKLQNRRPQKFASSQSPNPSKPSAEINASTTKKGKKGAQAQKAKTVTQSRGGRAQQDTAETSDDEESDSDGGGFFE